MIASCLSACREIDREQQDAIVEVFHRRRTMFKTPAHTTTIYIQRLVVGDVAAVDEQVSEDVHVAMRVPLLGLGDSGRMVAFAGPACVGTRVTSCSTAHPATTTISLRREHMHPRVMIEVTLTTEAMTEAMVMTEVMAQGLGAVSYTHLDVYKRQGEGGGDGGRSGCRGDRVDERVDGDFMPRGRYVLKRLRHRGRLDDSIASPVRRRRVHIAIDTGARDMRQDPVVVSEDEMGDPSNETQRDPVHAEELASNTDVIVTEEDTGFRITHPRSPAPLVGTEEETEFGGPGPLRQAQTRCTPAGAPVHSTGAGSEDSEARREPPPHTSDGGLEEGEVAPTPTCGKDGEDERPPTDHHVGLDCPPDSLPPTDELFTMDSALASLPDISLLISPTLPVVAPPEPARRDDARRDRGFDEFGGDTILHPPESGTPAIFHVGAPWAVEQGLAEEVARNRCGGPHVAAQRSLEGSLEAASGDCLAQGGHGSQLLSDGVSSVHPPEEGPQQEPHRGPAETLEARPPGVIRSDGGEGVSEDTAQPGSADGGRSFRGGIERRGSSTAHPSIVRPSTHDVGDGHTDEPQPHLTGMRGIMCPPPSRPSAAHPAAHGQAAPSTLPTRSFYDGAGMDRRAGDIGQTSAYGPADVPAGARSIGNVDGTCHDSMRAYEEQHGRPIRAKTSDVNDTRTTTARLSRARNQGTGTRPDRCQLPQMDREGRREVTEWTKQVEVRRDEAARSSSTTTAPQPLTILMTPITSRGSVQRTEMTAEVVA
ncbi:hypothetical protein CBR_g48613 [Chara braunii]|uniref:Uncharacterized protein n=1 Tax=Chara braunii TaxID=69332 RepID=A0A388M361_CHABU|nr:hypothetical protein CBR_g48613 [Chara braunii]|eukprot:GBG89004.1 hypothetical protein CBR_g48613 [Chara braunii]